MCDVVAQQQRHRIELPEIKTRAIQSVRADAATGAKRFIRIDVTLQA